MTLRSVDEFLLRKYRPDYTCLEFAADVWEAHTGTNIMALLKSFHTPVNDVKARRQSLRLGFELATPEDPCIVVMQRPKVTPHIGIYLRGRVLHLQPSGAEFQPVDVAARHFTRTKFYQCRP